MHENPRWQACIHESAHALLARIVGLGAGGATVVVGKAGAWTDGDGRRKELMTSLAGMRAERLVLGAIDVEGAADDMRRIEDLRRRNNLSDADMLNLAAEVDGLLAAHRDALERTAAALDQHETVGASEIDELVKVSD